MEPGGPVEESVHSALQDFHTQANAFLQDSAKTQLGFFLTMSIVGVNLSCFGHRQKGFVTFVVGGLLPVILHTVETETWLSVSVKCLTLVILGLFCGIVLVCSPKWIYGCLGGVLGGWAGRVMFPFLRSYVLKEQCIASTQLWAYAATLLVCSSLSAHAFSFSGHKLYCLLVPVIASSLAAEGVVQTLIIFAKTWKTDWTKYFPEEISLLLRKGAAEGKPEGFQMDFATFRLSWGIWIGLMMFFCIIGVFLQIRQYRDEKERVLKEAAAELSDEEDEELLLA